MTTIQVPEELLKKAMRVAGEKSSQDVVVEALQEYAARRNQADLIKLLGTFEDFMTPEELDQMRSERMERHGAG
jgi:hypothetical protein